MVRGGRRKTVDPDQAEKYRRVGAALVESARALLTVADEGDRFGNAIGIVAVHAAIAYTDALTVSYAGFKSTEGDHRKAADALQGALTHRAEPGKLTLLRSILGVKDEVSYAGTFYRVEDAERVLTRTLEFAAWAEELLRRRGPMSRVQVISEARVLSQCGVHDAATRRSMSAWMAGHGWSRSMDRTVIRCPCSR